MRLPTVRVKHPVLGFVTINASDLTEGHELHEEQAEGFDPAHLAVSGASAPLDPALRDAAATLGLGLVAMRRRMEGQPFEELPPAEKLVAVRAAQVEFDASLASYEASQRERAANEAQEREHDPENDEHAGIDEAGSEAADVDQADEANAPELTIAKGPRGLWFVMRGEQRVSRGMPSEAEAQALLDQAVQGEG